MTHDSTSKILILGAGFGGLYLVRRLARGLARARLRAEITLVDRNNYSLFIPLLHEAMVERVEMHHILHPIRQTLRRLPVTFRETEVEGIDLAARQVHTRAGILSYDYLVLALGSVANYFGNEHFARYSLPMKTPDDAYRLRSHVIDTFRQAAEATDPERRRQLLTFVIVGAGYTGQEVATELHDLIHASLLRDYPEIHPDEVRLIVVDGHPGLPVPPNKGLARHALHVLQRKGIELRFNTRAKDAGPGWVELGDERIPTGSLIWTSGVQANPVAASLPGEKGSMGRLPVLPTLQLPGHPEVFVIGDNAYLKAGEHALLPTAQVAGQEGTATADNLLRLLQGDALRPFQYHQKVEIETLGSYDAVTEVGKLHFHGVLGWLILNVIYLYIQYCWRERFRIASDWTLNLFFPPDTYRVKSESSPDE